jgi:hypothetical protein
MSNDTNFRLKSVAEFLDGDHHFFIPSYQRGYRWDKKQVEDLLEDIWTFAKTAKNKEFYCLQPVVVKEKKWQVNDEQFLGWEVIDGQQRLTTLWLILEYIKEGPAPAPFVLYSLNYETRGKMDLSNPDKSRNIDEFYISRAKRIIKDWLENRKIEDETGYSAFKKVLFKTDEINQVKFIWYVVEDKSDLKSIKAFNNLNRGKISLTNAELIKALFVLNVGNKEYSINELMLEWNMIENALHDDKFWLFLANKDYNPSTRIDLIFDFLTGKTTEKDNDYSYRKFQSLHDKTDLSLGSFEEAWKEVKSIYQLFLFWYEDNTLYHYIGYLLAIGVSHQTIFDRVNGLSKNCMLKEIKLLIKEKVNVSVEELKGMSYENKDAVRKILLLFNIESCINSNAYRFPFDLYKKDSWDIEHITSQKDKPLQETKDKIEWLNFAKTINCDKEEWEELKNEALDLARKLEETKKDEGNKFPKIYERIIDTVDGSIDDDDKDWIGNLALLDAGTNRSYGNALFQTKREIILDKDSKGYFIPPCTKNIFLKYYTPKSNPSQLNIWSQSDADDYAGKIKEIINDFIK